MRIVNISAYKFTNLTRLATLRVNLQALCQKLMIKGTILLAEEGINLMLAGEQEAIEQFIDKLTADERFRDITIKTSFSEDIPFTRLKVRIKPEIITMGDETVKPAEKTGEYLPPATLKQWLDEDADIFLLDTRNAYEVEKGTFKQAVDLQIDHFREFPTASEQLNDIPKDKPVVMFCTGGIRCEKASTVLLDKGFKNVYQLEGGIISYFDQCGNAHYQGDCFVFDDRVVVKAKQSKKLL